jgi:hypothetical protein
MSKLPQEFGSSVDELRYRIYRLKHCSGVLNGSQLNELGVLARELYARDPTGNTMAAQACRIRIEEEKNNSEVEQPVLVLAYSR